MAGDPDLKTTEEALKRLDAAGADVIELGIPYSVSIASPAFNFYANVCDAVQQLHCMGLTSRDLPHKMPAPPMSAFWVASGCPLLMLLR